MCAREDVLTVCTTVVPLVCVKPYRRELYSYRLVRVDRTRDGADYAQCGVSGNRPDADPTGERERERERERGGAGDGAQIYFLFMCVVPIFILSL